MLRRYLFALVFSAAVLPARATSIVIGFDGVANGPFADPIAEDGFIVDLPPGSGALFVVNAFGNPEPHVEGSAIDPEHQNGGVLRIRRQNGGRFKFESANISNWLYWANQPQAIPSLEIDFFGYSSGVAVGVDQLLTLDVPAAPDVYGDVWVTRWSNALNGVAIDELRIALDAIYCDLGAEAVDNIVVAVSSPTPLALLAPGLGLGLVWFRRRNTRMRRAPRQPAGGSLSPGMR